MKVKLVKIRAGWYEAFGPDGWRYKLGHLRGDRTFKGFCQAKDGQLVVTRMAWLLTRVNDPSGWSHPVATLRGGRELIADMPLFLRAASAPPRNKGLVLLK